MATNAPKISLAISIIPTTCTYGPTKASGIWGKASVRSMEIGKRSGRCGHRPRTKRESRSPTPIRRGGFQTRPRRNYPGVRYQDRRMAANSHSSAQGLTDTPNGKRSGRYGHQPRTKSAAHRKIKPVPCFSWLSFRGCILRWGGNHRGCGRSRLPKTNPPTRRCRTCGYSRAGGACARSARPGSW